MIDKKLSNISVNIPPIKIPKPIIQINIRNNPNGELFSENIDAKIIDTGKSENKPDENKI